MEADMQDLFVYDAASDHARCVANLRRDELAAAWAHGYLLLTTDAFRQMIPGCP